MKDRTPMRDEDMKLKVGERWIGDGQPCFVIAEAGANHNRDLGMAKELIAVAARRSPTRARST